MVNVALKTHLSTVSWAGWLLAIGASICFSVTPPVARHIIMGGMDPTLLLLARLVLGGLLLTTISYLTSPERLRIDQRGFLLSFGIGTITGVALLSFFWSLTRIEASLASMMLSMSPLVVLSLLALRGERFTRRHIVRLALGLGGVYLLIGPGGQVDWVGVILALAAVLMFAFQLVIVQWFLQGYDPRSIALYSLIPMTIVIGGWWLIQDIAWQTPTLEGWLAIGSLAVVSTFLARVMLYAAIRRIGSGQMALLTPLETLLTILWSIIFLGERLTFMQWIGGGFILLSALLAIKRMRRG